MCSHAIKPNIGFPLEPGWEIINGQLVPVHIKGSMAPELMEDLICLCSNISNFIIHFHAVKTVCIAQSCAHVIAMKTPHSVGDQDVQSEYDGDDDDNDNDSESNKK